MATGRLEQALRRARTAQQLDPLSPSTTAAETMVLTYMGRCEAAIRRCKESLEMHPYFIELRYVLGIAYQRLGMLEEAVAAFEAGATLSGREPLILGWLGAAYAAAGRRDQALQILEELSQREQDGTPFHLPFAVVHIGLGQTDQAFERLFQAVDAYDALVCYIQIVPTYDPLRGDPRYLELLTRLGMTPVGDPTATLHFSEGTPGT
jgi:serine/threonine-protein kinase